MHLFRSAYEMTQPAPHSGAYVAPNRVRTTALVAVFALTAANWLGWATGSDTLTRLISRWPPMLPWTAVWLAVLAIALLLQVDGTSERRVWLGRALAAVVGVGAAVVLGEYLTGRSSGIDTLWFAETLRNTPLAAQGHPYAQTAISALLLSIAVGATWLTSRIGRRVWMVSLAAAMVLPGVAVLAYVFDVIAQIDVRKSTGMALMTALALLLLGTATLFARPDRGSVARLLAMPNRASLLRLGAAVAGFPLLVGLSRRIFLALGSDTDEALTFSAAGGTAAVGLLMFYLTQREWKRREATELERVYLRAVSDNLLDPQILLEGIRDASGELTDLRYLSANTAACSYLKVKETDLIGHTQVELSPTMKDSELQHRYFRCLEDGMPVVIDDLVVMSDLVGAVRHYDIRATRAGADQLSLTWRDVTDRADAAHQLVASEQNFRLLAENSADVVLLTRDGKFRWVSPSVEEVLGAPPDYWVGRELWEIIPAEDAKAHVARIKTLVEGGLVKGRARVIALDGTTHWVHLHAKPFYDADGRRDGTCAAFRVIDAEVVAEQAADEAIIERARSDARFRRSMESSAIGICLLAPAGGFTDVNNAACALFGYDAESLKQMTWQELTAEEYLDADLHNVADVKAGRRDSYRMLKQYIHADGHRIWADLAVAAMRDENGEVEQFIAQIIDITAEMHAIEDNAVLTEHLRRQSGRMAAELARAADYMASIMPGGLSGRVTVSSLYMPARELGGDCFHYAWIDDDHLLVYLIDVSGHGVEPALLAVSVHNLLRAFSITEEAVQAPETVLAGLNRLFQMDQQDDHYFTMWIGIYEASSRTLRYASAGAPPALAFNFVEDAAEGGGSAVETTELFTIAAPVGMFTDTRFTSADYHVPPGCQILLYSDGASDLRLPNGRQLAASQFRTLAARLGARGPTGISLDGFVAELRNLTVSNTFEDDCSMIHLMFD